MGRDWRIRGLVGLAALLVGFSAQVSAHGGGTNSYGCHNQTSTGTYHCHSGPYNGLSFDDEQAFQDYINANESPSVNILGSDKVITDTDGESGESFVMVATATDSDGTIASSVWKVGTTTVATGTYATITLSDGTYTLTFEATDDDGAVSTDSVLVTVVAPVANVSPSVSISGGNRTIEDTDGEAGETFSVSATATDSDGTIASTSWKLNGATIATGSSTQITLGDGVHAVYFEATDNDGETSSTSVLFTVFEPSSSGIPPYNRDDYLPDWDDADGDCINTRHEVLILESAVPVTMSSSGCSVISGQWNDPFTGLTFTNPSDVDVDHLVALSEAHESGAYSWTSEQKMAFANDMLRADALRAVDDGTNSSKSNRDPAEWLPPNSSYHCEYVRDWVEIKNTYDLTFDDAERAAIESVLGADISAGERPKVTGIREVPGDSSAVFKMGMTVNGGCGFTITASAGDVIDISISITPEPQHLGQTASMYLVASITGNLYSVSPIGALSPFGGQASDLVPFITGHVFQQSYEFTLLNGMLSESLSISLFAAYQTISGDFIYTPNSFDLVIND